MAKNLTPHDHYFRGIMSDRNVAVEFFDKHLPSKIKKIVNYSTIQIETGSFVDDELKEKITDILYSIEFNNEPGYIYVLIEHQNKPEKLMPLRILKYIISIMEQHISKKIMDNSATLPVIYPIIFYAGEKKYIYSTDLFDLFGGHRELVRQIFSSPYHLIDLQNTSDAEFDKLLLYGTMAITMKYIHSHKDNVLILIEKIANDLQNIEKYGNLSYIYKTIKYCCNVGNVTNQKELQKIINSSFSKAVGDEIMSYADTLRNEGLSKGLSKGREEGLELGKSQAIQKVVSRLLQQNIDIKHIVLATDLTEEQVLAIKNKKRIIK